ncbi:hypothetical protein BT96DRAFT_997754 [Gymnopus androsaceus JB14]|uniref:Uncharacterized protein n=1 Tax=Gymnopus androsaceus JB14 TaxID=1447944 RepID=A0A6A4HDJ1_9AGAR|nr:hypothetical protein BT96DRAFT_997754 [Gymnopus androsaceus JB14]
MGDVVSEIFDEAMRPSVNSLIFQFIFYGTFILIPGAYVVLGGVYVSLQLQQKEAHKRFQHPFYPISLLVLFVFATAGIILSTFDVENVIQEFIVVGFTELDPTSRQMDLINYRTAIGAIYGTANWLADMILVYRFIVAIMYGMETFGSLSFPLYYPSSTLPYRTPLRRPSKAGANELFATGESHEVTVGDNLNFVFLGITVFCNLVLTGLIAGRIWWLNRVHSRLLGTEGNDKRLSAMATMFIESGTLYPIALIVCLIIQVKGSTATMDPILLQIVGIVPTLIMVRTALGLGIDGAPPPQDEETELEAELRPSSRYPTDVKGKLPSSYPGTSTFVSEYASTPLKLETSTLGSSERPTAYGYNHVRTMSENPDQTESPAYDYRETGTGFRPEKMLSELKYEPPVSLTPNRSISEAGPAEIPSSSSRNQYYSNEKLQPVRHSYQRDDAV